MKAAFVFAFCFLAVFYQASANLGIREMKIFQYFARGHQKCQEETGLSSSTKEKMFKGEFSEEPEVKCFLKCLFENAGALNEDGSLNEEGLQDMKSHLNIRDDEIQKIMACGEEKGSDPCETAYNIGLCFIKG